MPAGLCPCIYLRHVTSTGTSQLPFFHSHPVTLVESPASKLQPQELGRGKNYARL